MRKNIAAMRIETVRNHLVRRHGFAEDELDVLFKTPDDLRQALDDALTAATNQDVGDDAEVDTYQLSSAEETILVTDEAVKKQAAQMLSVGRQMAAQKDYPKDAQVSEKEAEQVARDLESFDFDDLDEEEEEDDSDE